MTANDHVQLPAPMPDSFRCSCGALSVGIPADPALFADHLRAVGALDPEPDNSGSER